MEAEVQEQQRKVLVLYIPSKDRARAILEKSLKRALRQEERQQIFEVVEEVREEQYHSCKKRLKDVRRK